jgi:hypothetical protein
LTLSRLTQAAATAGAAAAAALAARRVKFVASEFLDQEVHHFSLFLFLFYTCFHPIHPLYNPSSPLFWCAHFGLLTELFL